MLYYFDFEFTGIRQDTEPISLGVISWEGDAFYAEFTDYDESKLNDWVRKHVLPRLGKPHRPNMKYVRGTRDVIRDELVKWFAPSLENNGAAYLVGDFPAYDWVLFCNLMGRNLYKNGKLCYTCLDLTTFLWVSGYDPDIDRGELAGIKATAHNALDDARLIKACWENLWSESGL